jgi:hypothetical protein
MRDKLIKSTESFLQGHIDKHIANIENLLNNNVALAEHPDIIETIEKELDVVAGYEDKLNVLKKYFGGSTSRELLNERVPGE